MMEQETRYAVSSGHLVDGDVLSTVTALAAGALASGKSYLLQSCKVSRAERLNDVIDLAMEIHLAADKPFAELQAEYAARQARYAAWHDRLGLLLGVPADALKAVDGDYDRLDKTALRKLGEVDAGYKAQRGAIYQQLAAGTTDVAVGVDMPAV